MENIQKLLTTDLQREIFQLIYSGKKIRVKRCACCNDKYVILEDKQYPFADFCYVLKAMGKQDLLNDAEGLIAEFESK